MELDRLPNFLMTTESDDDNIFETTYTEDPAVERDFYFFNNQKDNVKEQRFQILDSEVEEYERVTSGVWMMPDTKYLRQTEEGDFYTVEFTKEDLLETLKKHLKTGYGDNTQLEHNGNNLVTFETLEYWVIRDENTLSPIYGLSLEDLGYNFEDIPVGTVMKTSYVMDEQFWNDYILSGKVRGYSVGGMFTMRPDLRDEVMETKQSSLFRSMGLAQKEGSLILDNDSVIDLKEDVKINNEVVKDGEYTTKLGFVLTIKDGQLIEYGKVEETINGNNDNNDTLSVDIDNNDDIKTSDNLEFNEEPIVPIGESDNPVSEEPTTIDNDVDESPNGDDNSSNTNLLGGNEVVVNDDNNTNLNINENVQPTIDTTQIDISGLMSRLESLEKKLEENKLEYEKKLSSKIKENDQLKNDIVSLKEKVSDKPLRKTNIKNILKSDQPKSINKRKVRVGNRYI